MANHTPPHRRNWRLKIWTHDAFGIVLPQRYKTEKGAKEAALQLQRENEDIQSFEVYWAPSREGKGGV